MAKISCEFQHRLKSDEAAETGNCFRAQIATALTPILWWAVGCDACDAEQLAAGDTVSIRRSAPPTGDINVKLASTAFRNNAQIDAKYAVEGEDVSPPLAWTGVPEGTKSLALFSDKAMNRHSLFTLTSSVRNRQMLEAAHQYEHSLEVQLPFLQMTVDDFSLVPFAIGQASVSEVADVIDTLWSGDETLLVISSDLSHYRDYRTARALDAETSNLIEHFQWQLLSGERACGYGGIRGLLKIAQQRGLRVKTVDLRNSGDTSGTKDQVVGYGSYVIY